MCDNAVVREQRYTPEMNDTSAVCGEATSCFIPTFNPVRLTRPKIIAKMFGSIRVLNYGSNSSSLRDYPYQIFHPC